MMKSWIEALSSLEELAHFYESSLCIIGEHFSLICVYIQLKQYVYKHVLNFTKIHRQNYKKLSLSVEILIPPMFCKMRHSGFSISRLRETKEATLFLSRYII